MAEGRKRIKRQISDATEDSLQQSDSEESSEEYISSTVAPSSKANMSRPSRRSAGAITTNGTTSATISRSSSGSPDDRRQSIRLTVKAPPSKLREVMRANEVESLKDVIGGGRIVDGPRRSRNIPPPRLSGRRQEKPRYEEFDESDIEDDDEDEEDEDDDEDDQEDEEDDGDEDEPMRDANSEPDEEDDEMEEDEPLPPKKSAPLPRAPKITLKQPSDMNGKLSTNPKFIVTPADVGPVRSVEDQEMEDEDEEDGSSELSDDNDEEDDEDEEEEEEEEDEEDEEQEETMQLNVGTEHGEGEMLADEEELDEEDDELDSDDETPESGTATPDITKLTKRQRGRPEDSTELMALDMAPQQRKFFTDQEKAMKKDEHARKRKELTKRKIQEEKTAALNRLLKPQASKARGAAPRPENLAAAAAAAAAAGSPYDDEDYQEKANPLYTRWISNKDGVRLGVPDAWLGKRVGQVFGLPLPPRNGTLIQEL